MAATFRSYMPAAVSSIPKFKTAFSFWMLNCRNLWRDASKILRWRLSQPQLKKAASNYENALAKFKAGPLGIYRFVAPCSAPNVIFSMLSEGVAEEISVEKVTGFRHEATPSIEATHLEREAEFCTSTFFSA